MSIFAFIVLRGLNTALKEHDDFTRYAVAGLVTVFGLQSIINMGVNLQLMPAKGMTLPFISYGGSSHDRHLHLAGHGAGADTQAAGKAQADGPFRMSRTRVRRSDHGQRRHSACAGEPAAICFRRRRWRMS
jgi:hypothetical protein